MNSEPITENTKASNTEDFLTTKDAEDTFEEIAKIAKEEAESEEAVVEGATIAEEKEDAEPVITFEERWSQLLDNCKQKK